MSGSIWRPLAIASLTLLTLASCTLGTETPGIATVDSAIKLGSLATSTPSASASTSPSSTTQPSPSASSSEGESEGEDSDATPANAVFDYNAELSIEDQAGNGKTVVIEEFSVNIDNLWLVICTKSDRVLTALLTNNDSKPVTVTLDSSISASQELVAYLFLDNGDGRFDPQQDARVFEEPGELIEEDFKYEIG